MYSNEYLISRDMYDAIEDRIEKLDKEHGRLKHEHARIRHLHENWTERSKEEVVSKLHEIPEVVREEIQDFMFDPIWKDIDEDMSDRLNAPEISKKNFVHHREFVRAKHVLDMFPTKDAKKYLQILNDALPHYYMCHVQVMQYINNTEWAREQRNIARIARSTYRLASNMMASTSKNNSTCEKCERELLWESEDILRRADRTLGMCLVQKIEAREYHDTSYLFRKDDTLRRELLELY